MLQSETNNHFEMNDLDAKMRRAHQEASKVISKEQARKAARMNIILLGFLGVLVAVFLALIGII